MNKKNFNLRGGIDDSHFKGRLLWQVQGKLSVKLLEKMEVKYFISEMTHKYNVLINLK
jgi:hypothetical protein